MLITISRRNEHGEYVVASKGYPGADCHCTDIADARATAVAWAERCARRGVTVLVKDRSRVKGAEDITVYAPEGPGPGYV